MMTEELFKVREVDRDETCPSGDGYDRGNPFIVFYAQVEENPPTKNPSEIENLAISAVLDEVGDRFAFCETEWIDDRTISVTAFRF
jgi:hypothetical protein